MPRQKETLANHAGKAAASQIIHDQLTTAFPFQSPSNLSSMLLRFRRTALTRKNTPRYRKGEDSTLKESCG